MSRYIKHILLDEVAEQGQQKISNATVAIVGCGGLGSIVAPYLCGAGVGRLILIDGDEPHISNLHRQVFYTEDDLTDTKSTALGKRCQALNSDIEILALSKMISKENINEVLFNADLVVECTDHMQTKYIVNDYCHIHRKPLVYGAMHKYEGYVSTFVNTDADDIHLRDIFPEPNDEVPTCSQVGVLNTLAGLIGVLQANEVIKLITAAGELLSGTLLTYNILHNDQFKLKLRKTYKQNIEEIYDQYDYHSDESCRSFEITWDTVSNDRNLYDLISILPEEEHESIDDQVLRLDGNSTPVRDKARVYYCMSGKRSAVYVQQLLQADPMLKVYSLKGGLLGVKTYY